MGVHRAYAYAVVLISALFAQLQNSTPVGVKHIVGELSRMVVIVSALHFARISHASPMIAQLQNSTPIGVKTIVGELLRMVVVAAALYITDIDRASPAVVQLQSS